ncbi:site-specific DNA-methyltransferase [Campylobacter fetus]|nr:site-specific DNA-methyltransferase [Campylobacter fetus]
MIDKKNIKEANIIEPIKDGLYDTLKSKFPQTINSDGAVNFDAIKMLLGIGVKENIKGYELNWIGKGLANALYNTPCDKELKFEPTKSKDIDTTQNVIIRGDNLDALKLLKSAYYEKVKMIYIDPPYNTKNENFIYPDDFRRDYKQICIETELIKIEVDEFGNETEVPSEAMNFFTSATNTKSHSGWLSFMLPRLKLARDLLRDDGVIFISIDDNEQANLKILCDEIFGEENFVACLPRVTKKAGKSTNKIALNHDYLLCYGQCELSQVEVDEKEYKEKDEFFDERGGYKLNQTLDYNSLQYSKTMDYEIKIDYKLFYAGSDKALFEERAKGNHNRIDWVWRWSKDKFDFGLENGFIEIRNNRIYTKTYYKCKISDKKPYKIEYFDRTKNVSSLEFIDNKYSNDNANKNLQSIFEQKNIFDYSKSVEMVKFLITQACCPTNGDIILDFFAGSGTTAHAVMEQNAIDGGNRKFILVQLDEKIDEKKSKTAFDFCKNELKSISPNISDITIERVKRAGEKIEAKTKNLDLGFCVYDMTSKEDIVQVGDELTLYQNLELSPQDRALNLALQSGKMLDLKFKEICKNKLYKSSNVYYIIGFDDEVIKRLEETTDELVFMSGYSDISLESFLNLQSILKDRLNVVY